MSINPYANERNIRFLNESNKIESFTEIDYNEKTYQKVDKGHFGAFVASQELAAAKKTLTAKAIKTWQKLISEEQIPFGHHIEENQIGHLRSINVRIVGKPTPPPHHDDVPLLLSNLLEDINNALKDPKKFQDDAEFSKFTGESFLEYERIHPFADGNGRTGRLIANYIATYCERPIIEFDSERTKRRKYYDAHDSKKLMTEFMAEKVKEAIVSTSGKILQKKRKLEGDSCLYESTDKKEIEVVHWHGLSSHLKSNSSP